MGGNWNSMTIRVDDDVKSAIGTICKNRGIKRHAFLTELVKREVEPIINPDAHLQQGFPLIGKMLFEYNPQGDHFSWKLELGPGIVNTIAEDIPPRFLTELSKAIDLAVDERSKVLDKVPRGKTIVPHELTRYKVR